MTKSKKTAKNKIAGSSKPDQAKRDLEDVRLATETLIRIDRGEEKTYGINFARQNLRLAD